MTGHAICNARQFLYSARTTRAVACLALSLGAAFLTSESLAQPSSTPSGRAAATTAAPASNVPTEAPAPTATVAGATAATADAGSQALHDFSIPAQSLSEALLRFSEQSGTQLFFDAPMARKLSSAPLSGRYTSAEALTLLLKGTGLTPRFVKPNVFTLEKAPAQGGAHVLGPVRVEGATAGAAVAGINGSTDPTATEGTHSYTSSALSIASKTAQSIKETPQSVSVITQQRMQDQNLTDFTSVMNQATGVTVVTGQNGPFIPSFYSRGFEINSFQIDGGAPLSTTVGGGGVSGYFPVIDMAIYDHVEILRGADGLFNGYGNPNGSVNLTRKRPLDHDQVILEGDLGSWKNYREMIDATAPLGFDGKLRGRIVISNQDQDYFYDTASDKHTLVYGIAEADLTSSTTASVGFSDNRQNDVPWTYGLPRYQSGADLELPRGTCLCFDWNRWDLETKELFTQLEQHLGADWSFKLNVTRSDQQNHLKYGYATGTVNPVTLAGPRLYGTMNDYSSVQTLTDFTVNGAFELFGQRQQLVFGGNYQDVDSGGNKGYSSLYTTSSATRPVNVFDLDPSSAEYIEPASQLPGSYLAVYSQKQWGLYANLRLTLWTPLHFIAGVRYSQYSIRSLQDNLCNGIFGTVCTAANQGQAYSSSYTHQAAHDFSWPPTYSLIYDVSKSISLYASYTDIYLPQVTYVDESGKPLAPITGSNVEAGVKWEALGGKLNTTLAAYRIEQKNYPLRIGYGAYSSTYGALPDGIHFCCYSDGSNQINLSEGVDAEVTGEVLPGWQLFAGYTYNLNEYEGSDYYGAGQPLVSYVPKHLLKLWTSYQFQRGEWLRRLNIGGGVNAQTSSYNSGSACTVFNYGTDPTTGLPTATCNTSTPYNYVQGFYAVFSGHIAFQIDKHWNLALNVNNVADRRYYQTMGSSDGGNWYGDPRNFMLTVRGSF